MATTSNLPTFSALEIPDEVMNRITCIKCNNTLSVVPVYGLSDGSNVCGRCIGANPEGIKNTLYETLLECLVFPCMNKRFGCMESRNGKNMFEHEIKCRYRRINCPTFKTTSCDWIGEIDNLLEHFENNHARNLLKETSFEINFIHDYEEVCLMPYAESLFLVKRHGNLEVKKFWCSVQTVFTNEHEEFQFFVTLKNPSNGITKQLPHKMAVSLNDLDGVEVKFDDIEKNLQNPSIVIATIDIVEFVKISSVKSIEITDYLSESNLEMLKIIECPICFEYMVPPIFQCSGGHSICGECKSQVQQCPTCQKQFGETQNYAVESFTSFLKYPCKNLERGCEYLSPAKDIRIHEKMCIFGAYECPTSAYTSCKWTGLRENIWSHCKDYHGDNVMEAPFISIPFDEGDQEEPDVDCFVFKFLKNIFVLHWLYNEREKVFNWALQLVGPPENSKNYYFDLDIIDRSGRNLRIFMRCPCESFTDKDRAFDQDKFFIFLAFDQVKSLINEVFCFKISIYKNLL